MTLNIVVQYYADLSFNANFRQSFRRFWRWMPDLVGHDVDRCRSERVRYAGMMLIVALFLLFVVYLSG